MNRQLAISKSSPELETILTRLLAERAGDWFAGGRSDQGAVVQLLGRQARRVSTVLRFRIEIDDQERVILAKQYRSWRTRSRRSNAQEPPRLFSPPAVDEKALLEHAALSTIYHYFNRLSDWRFATVRPLAVLPLERTIVMEHAAGDSLEHLLSRNHRLASGQKTPQLDDAFRNAGAWLREFHQLPAPPQTRVRLASRDDLLRNIDFAIEYLARAASYAELLTQARESLSSAASAELPEALPLGWSHSDFAPRNVLVRGSGRVAIIDTLGRWQAPIYEDLGHFLAAMETAENQMMSQGWLIPRRTIAQCQRDFLIGYFDSSEPPWTAIRLFEAQAILFKWASVVAGLREARGMVALAKRCRLAARSRYLASYLARTVEEISA